MLEFGYLPRRGDDPKKKKTLRGSSVELQLLIFVPQGKKKEVNRGGDGGNFKAILAMAIFSITP